MPVTPDTSDDRRCINPRCKGVAVVVPGSHVAHGAHEWWARRIRRCRICGSKFQTDEQPIPGTIEIHEPPEQADEPSPQMLLAFEE